jgi:5-carboxymethyl-2-hydroxymuconate isomerase
MRHLIIERVSAITNRVWIKFKRAGIERAVMRTGLFTALDVRGREGVYWVFFLSD